MQTGSAMSKELDKLMESANEAFQNQDYTQAETRYKAAMWEAERSGSPLSVAICLDRLAEVYFEQGRYDESEPLYRRALEVRENQLDPQHEDIVQSLNNLSAVYFFLEQYDKAEPICTRLTEIYEKVLGPDN